METVQSRKPLVKNHDIFWRKRYTVNLQLPISGVCQCLRLRIRANREPWVAAGEGMPSEEHVVQHLVGSIMEERPNGGISATLKFLEVATVLCRSCFHVANGSPTLSQLQPEDGVPSPCAVAYWPLLGDEIYVIFAVLDAMVTSFPLSRSQRHVRRPGAAADRRTACLRCRSRRPQGVRLGYLATRGHYTLCREGVQLIVVHLMVKIEELAGCGCVCVVTEREPALVALM